MHIVPQDEQAHRDILESLNKKIDIENIAYGTCDGPFDLIISARSALAVPYQIKLMRPYVWNVNWILVDSLEKAGTKEATLGLVELVKNDEKHPDLSYDSYTIPTAIRAVYAIRKKGDPEILKATEEFIKTHPCPKKPFLMPD